MCPNSLKHYVKCRISKRQFLRIAFVPIHFNSRDVRVLPRSLQQFRCEIEPRNPSAQPRRRNRNNASPRMPRPARVAPSERPTARPALPRKA